MQLAYNGDPEKPDCVPQSSTDTEPMKTKLIIATSTLLLAAAPLSFACDYPDRPSIPDGSTATKEQMLTAKTDVTTYLEGVDAYLLCLEEEEKAAVADLAGATQDELERRDEMLNKKFDAANDEKALVGEEFNQQVRAYNAARQ